MRYPQYFGKAQYFLNVIEFQKRVLVYCHIVIKFEGLSLEAGHEVDTWILTNLPNENIANGELREKVIKNIIQIRNAATSILMQPA